MRKRGGATALRLLAAAGCAAMLAGCMTSFARPEVVASIPMDYRQRHPIVIKEGTRTVELFTAYRKGRGPAELHVFQIGAHGFLNKGGGADHFMDRLEEWLGANKLLSRSADRAPAATP